MVQNFIYRITPQARQSLKKAIAISLVIVVLFICSAIAYFRISSTTSFGYYDNNKWGISIDYFKKNTLTVMNTTKILKTAKLLFLFLSTVLKDSPSIPKKQLHVYSKMENSTTSKYYSALTMHFQPQIPSRKN